ncbi:hypothetical protein AHAS_Ahas06G0059800 [Arachis hypogaea]
MKYPSFYVLAVMILILVFLTVFGRSVVTLCTCVLWYEYVRGLSEKKMVVMNEGLNSPSNYFLHFGILGALL